MNVESDTEPVRLEEATATDMAPFESEFEELLLSGVPSEEDEA